MDDLLSDPKIDALIASVRWSANPELYRRLASWDRQTTYIATSSLLGARKPEASC